MGDNKRKMSKRTHNQLIAQAREFRKYPTKAEAFLWDRLRDRQLGGYKFKRQRVFGPFILDFYCPEIKLAVELDGEIHLQQREADTARTKHLQAYKVTVIRFDNEAVLNEIERVLDEILGWCERLSLKE
jgi:very-short-patch-repair endonuclease